MYVCMFTCGILLLAPRVAVCSVKPSNFITSANVLHCRYTKDNDTVNINSEHVVNYEVVLHELCVTDQV